MCCTHIGSSLFAKCGSRLAAAFRFTGSALADAIDVAVAEALVPFVLRCWRSALGRRGKDMGSTRSAGSVG